jgi:hypothetical protein
MVRFPSVCCNGRLRFTNLAAEALAVGSYVDTNLHVGTAAQFFAWVKLNGGTGGEVAPQNAAVGKSKRPD